MTRSFVKQMRAVRRSGGSTSFALIGAFIIVGCIAAGLVLQKQRLSFTVGNFYDLTLRIKSANGVAPGLGQPVAVAGVKVGTIVDAKLADGVALVRVSLNRDVLPAVYSNATATLEPVSPLNDMQIVLVPGGKPHKPIEPGEQLTLAQTGSPEAFDRLLSSLDSDTRNFLQSFVVSVGVGLDGQGQNLRNALSQLWPTTKQSKRIAAEMDRNRRSISSLVTNIADVSEAASVDGVTPSLISNVAELARRIAQNSKPLEQSVSELPSALQNARRVLNDGERLLSSAQRLQSGLKPSFDVAPNLLRSFADTSDSGSRLLEQQVTPLVSESVNVADNQAKSVVQLNNAMKPTTSFAQGLNYAGNEMAFNPEKREPTATAAYEGGLYSLAWANHNWSSVLGVRDAQGNMTRSIPIISCTQITQLEDISGWFRQLFGKTSICPGADLEGDSRSQKRSSR